MPNIPGFPAPIPGTPYYPPSDPQNLEESQYPMVYTTDGPIALGPGLAFTNDALVFDPGTAPGVGVTSVVGAYGNTNISGIYADPTEGEVVLYLTPATPINTGGLYGRTDPDGGTANTFLGTFAGLGVTSGNYNTLIGISAGDSITTGLNNTVVGANAGGSVAAGNFNTILGSAAGASHTGQQSTFVGALAGNTGANQSVCVGYNSGRFTTGLNNTFVGTSSGNNVSTGGSNICIGYNAGALIGAGSNNTLVGGWSGSSNLQSNVVISDGQGNIRFQATPTGAVSIGSGGLYGTAGQVFTSAGSGSAAGWATPAALNITGTIPNTGVPTTIYQTTIPNNGVFSAWGYLTVYSGNNVIKTYTVSMLNTYSSFSGMAGPGATITAGSSYQNPTAPEPVPTISVLYGTGQGGGVVSLYATASNGAFNFSLTLFRTV